MDILRHRRYRAQLARVHKHRPANIQHNKTVASAKMVTADRIAWEIIRLGKLCDKIQIYIIRTRQNHNINHNSIRHKTACMQPWDLAILFHYNAIEFRINRPYIIRSLNYVQKLIALDLCRELVFRHNKENRIVHVQVHTQNACCNPQKAQQSFISLRTVFSSVNMPNVSKAFGALTVGKFSQTRT